MKLPVRVNSLGLGFHSRSDRSSNSRHSDAWIQPDSLSDSFTSYHTPFLAITGNVAPLGCTLTIANASPGPERMTLRSSLSSLTLRTVVSLGERPAPTGVAPSSSVSAKAEDTAGGVAAAESGADSCAIAGAEDIANRSRTEIVVILEIPFSTYENARDLQSSRPVTERLASFHHRSVAAVRGI